MIDQEIKPSRLGVVIVNYQTPVLAERCVAALAPMLSAADARAVIVDNDSQDGSYERLRDYCANLPERERIMVVEAGCNGGFSAGNNIGVAALQADYILLLNSDAIVHASALDELLVAADAAPDAGIITPRIVSSAGEEQVSRFRDNSPLSEFIDGAQTGPVTKLFRSAETPIYTEDWSTVPDWVSFAAVLIRKRAIEMVGKMDEGFFLYYEDCDYCRRIRSSGFKIAFAPKAVFTHDAGGSTNLRESENQQSRLPSYYYASRSRYFRKYYGPMGPLLANAAWLLGRGIAHLRGLFGRPAPTVCAERARDIWIGWRDDASKMRRD
ncbi:MAG: glycosyltransferase family 2 protein [Alphaproteobacteria bacterium]|nr:glycosyltransferase family 2 protein [Alphaproteobacteria bacterium]